MSNESIKKIIGNRIQARQNGELPVKAYKQSDTIKSRWAELRERQEIKAAGREVWEE